MTKIELIEKIEGEARLHFEFKDNKIDFVNIEFFSTRNIENILQNKPALDALVINPRICGICGHAHLIATVKAIEDCYDEITISKKANILRELTLNFEIIQNHFKWFYLTLLPLFGYKNYLKFSYPTNQINKAIATIAGQYPHNSYAIVGGIVSEITNIDIITIENYIDNVIRYYWQNIVKNEKILECKDIDSLLNVEGDLSLILQDIIKNNWQYIGKSYDRFIVFGENSYFTSGKSQHTRVSKNLNINEVKEFVNQNSYAKNVQYKNKYYEVGALSRAMLNKTTLIKEAHRKYGDSIFTRIIARVCEIPQLLYHSKKLLKQIDINEPSYIKPKIDISKISGKGVGVVEAARGSLIHKVTLDNGKINHYDIITPTQWNLSNGDKTNLAISQKAMIGLDDTNLAQIVFKSFDVCSVCTTH
jgi:hydrogenase large subunit